jgi:hypothetical protein
MEKEKKETLERYLLHWDAILFNEASFEYGLKKLELIKQVK